MSIEDNVEARKAFTEVWDLVEAFALELTEEQQKAYWSLIAEKAKPQKQEVKIPSGALDDDDLKKFENELVPLGKFSGWKVKDVPLDYLIWLVENDFASTLRRYFLHPKVQHERRLLEHDP